MGALLGKESKHGELVQIEIDHRNTCLANNSGDHAIMIMAVKRTGTIYSETQLVTTHFCKSLKPRQSLQCNNDYQITDTEKVAKAGGWIMQSSPGLVFLELLMPEMSGCQKCSQ